MRSNNDPAPKGCDWVEGNQGVQSGEADYCYDIDVENGFQFYSWWTTQQGKCSFTMANYDEVKLATFTDPIKQYLDASMPCSSSTSGVTVSPKGPDLYINVNQDRCG